ncbi:MAG: glycosyltransferase family 4 protein [Rubrivivax sp.]|nr:glycosyltransferase family 4 protein [Rubrivivax sp.]
MSLRLLILTQYFPPEVGAPQARLSEQALRLRDLGVDVEVLTAMPSYPTGRIFDGWRGRWFAREQWRGLPVLRCAVYPTQSPRTLPRLLNYFSFVVSSAIVGVFLARRCDVVLVESPPLFLGLAGVLVAASKRARMVLNVSDLWPETAVALGVYDRRSLAVRLAVWLEKVLYRASSVVTGQSDGIVRGVLDKHPGAQVVLVPGGVDCTTFAPARRDRARLSPLGCDGKFVVGYAGLIGVAQGIGLLLDVARRLAHRDDIVFVIAGDGPQRNELEQRAGPNVVFAGLWPKAEMPALVASFDLALIPLVATIPGALPSKMYEAMASEVPIVLAADGDPRELLERAGCGLAVPYGDADAVTAAVLHLCDDAPLARSLGRAGRAYVLEHHRREATAERLHAALQLATAGTRA